MGVAVASSSIRPKALQKTLTATRRDFDRASREWQDSYPGFKERLPSDQRARLKEVGRLLWCFDLRFCWATGIREVAFDDEIVTMATTAPTREGYFLLMRLVDLWFCADLAFDMYKRLLVPSHIENPSFLVQLKNDAPKRLRPALAAADGFARSLETRLKKPAARERFTAYLETLRTEADRSVAAQHIGYGLNDLERGQALKPHHIAAIAQTIRNRYVHGGETAHSHGFPAQEKAPVLRHLCGFVQVVSLAMAAAAGQELNRQLRMHARM